MKIVASIILILFSTIQAFAQAEPVEFYKIANQEPDTDLVEIPNVDPSFPGGNHLVKAWFKSNLKYPEIAIELGEQGIVYVMFTVETDGTLTHIEALRGGLIEEMNNEAIRLMELMPNWTPGQANGEVVRVRCRVPVVFVFE